jgi:prepilin-type N-terminal cleavage/methylation domain-containing protein
MIKRKGFTIIELIVVIAIIAVLAGIVLVNVQGYVSKSREASIKADMHQLETAATTYFSENGSYNNICANSTEFVKIKTAVEAITNQQGLYTFCLDNTNGGGIPCNGAWFAAARMVVGGVATGFRWCVDSTGIATELPRAANYCNCLGVNPN